jgi:DinB superfamily
MTAIANVLALCQSVQMLTRPDRPEYADFYVNYIAKVPDGDVIAFLSNQPAAYRRLLSSLSDGAASARPQPGKWNVKEIIGHLCDAERIQSYRALRFARGDQKELHGFEQDDYVREAHSDRRSLSDLLDEFEDLRRSTVALVKSFPPDVEQRSGVANGAPISVRAMVYVIAGHTQHHYNLLKERFDKAAGAAH